MTSREITITEHTIRTDICRETIRFAIDGEAFPRTLEIATDGSHRVWLQGVELESCERTSEALIAHPDALTLDSNAELFTRPASYLKMVGAFGV